MNIYLEHKSKIVSGIVRLEGSKSISNRLLIMQALSQNAFAVEQLSPSDDSVTLKRILDEAGELGNVGAAGTTMRFLTAYYSIIPGQKLLTGSERMKKRPIGILVDALRTLGAEIQYLENEGYPPLKIIGKELKGGKVSVAANVSSQYISALLMIGPYLHNGLELELTGKISSYPYINMTLQMMGRLGIHYSFAGNKIKIEPGNYSGATQFVESDWSAASYYFSIAALSKGAELTIEGLSSNSLQGDSVLPEIYSMLGVESTFSGNTMALKNTGKHTGFFTYDFSDCPDLAQTVAVTCAALGVACRFTGLESLRIKETDRTAALANELKKFDVQFYPDGEAWMLKGKTSDATNVIIQTYDDHRMAMCFAPMALRQPLTIEDKNVVNKSYPSFWSDLELIGFSVSPV